MQPFFLGIWQLCRAPLQSVIAVTTLPFVVHFLVLLIQGSVALIFVPAEQVQFGLIAGVVAFGWTITLGFFIARYFGVVDRIYKLLRLEFFDGRVQLKDLFPYFLIFVAFAAADVFIQGSASRAFGIEIDWVAMVAGIPVLYFMMMLPSFGNFGTREIVWANVFHGYGDEASLFAFALWTNVVFLVMHVFIGVLFLNRAMSLLSDLRRTRSHIDSVRQPILRDAMDP